MRIESFDIGGCEVNRELCEAVMSENPRAFGNCLRRPVWTVGDSRNGNPGFRIAQTARGWTRRPPGVP